MPAHSHMPADSTLIGLIQRRIAATSLLTNAGKKHLVLADPILQESKSTEAVSHFPFQDRPYGTKIPFSVILRSIRRGMASKSSGWLSGTPARKSKELQDHSNSITQWLDGLDCLHDEWSELASSGLSRFLTFLCMRPESQPSRHHTVLSGRFSAITCEHRR